MRVKQKIWRTFLYMFWILKITEHFVFWGTFSLKFLTKYQVCTTGNFQRFSYNNLFLLCVHDFHNYMTCTGTFHLFHQDGQVPAVARPDGFGPAPPAWWWRHVGSVWFGQPAAGVGGGGARQGAPATCRPGERADGHRAGGGGAHRSDFCQPGQAKPALPADRADKT